MAVRPGIWQVAQGRCAKAVEVGVIAGDARAARVAVVPFEPRGLAGADLGHGDGVIAVVGLELSCMAAVALRLAVEQGQPGSGVGGQGASGSQETVKRAIVAAPFEGDEIGDHVGDVMELDLCAAAKDYIEPGAVVRDGLDPFCKDIPRTTGAGQKALPHGLCDVVFGVMPGHLVARKHREHGLCGQSAVKADLHFRTQRGANAGGTGGVLFETAVMEEPGEFRRAKVEQRGRVARDALFGWVVGVDRPVDAQPRCAIAKAKRQPVARAKARVVAGGAGHGLVARQDRVVEQQVAQLDPCHVRLGKGCVCPGERSGDGSRRQEREEGGEPLHSVASTVRVRRWR